jgi:hypothetical protein
MVIRQLKRSIRIRGRTMELKLKPCPFCGLEKVKRRYEEVMK